MNIEKINNLAEFATSYKDEVSNKECLIVDKEVRTCEEFSINIINHAKRFVSLGLHKGDRVGILLFNSIEYLEIIENESFYLTSNFIIGTRFFFF